MNKILFLCCLLLIAGCSSELSRSEEQVVENKALQLAGQWNDAWNGEIDLDAMMDLHHPELQYYWHGEPMSYNGFKEVLQQYVIGKESYNNILINPRITVVDRNNAIIGFQLISEGESPEAAETAFTLVITKNSSGWKIIHIHEG